MKRLKKLIPTLATTAIFASTAFAIGPTCPSASAVSAQMASTQITCKAEDSYYECTASPLATNNYGTGATWHNDVSSANGSTSGATVNAKNATDATKKIREGLTHLYLSSVNGPMRFQTLPALDGKTAWVCSYEFYKSDDEQGSTALWTPAS